MRREILPRLFLFLGLSIALASASRADDPCAAFTWDVGHERTLFAEEAQLRTAGKTVQTSPTLRTDQLYQLRLQEQSQVAFVTPPDKKSPSEASYAGLASLTVDSGGLYRIALDQPLWVDVMAGDSLLRAEAYQGRPGCDAPHKIVEFMLPARTPITLQFSGSRLPAMKLTVTRSPAAAAAALPPR